MRTQRGLMFWVFWLAACLVLAFITLPLLALVLHPSLGQLREAAMHVGVRDAFLVSLEGAALSTALSMLFGVPLAYLLARQQFRGKTAIETIVDLPLTVPHTIAGIALLLVFSRHGWLGPAAAHLGLSFWGTFAGVVLAMAYVGLPYAVNAARVGFEAVDPRLEKAARSLGAGPWATFTGVSLPLAWRGVMTGLTLCFARAIGEFAAVVLLAYYPMSAPVKIYELFLQAGLNQSVAASVLFLTIVLGLFCALRLLAYGRRVERVAQA
ncbi:ABC transporter permease [Thiomonas delicata]|uniref:Molybdate/tungstate transport system permease protein WtpB n=1 Tax=Thiomonas delicata TaxID=364030 RepID=A0A238D846_THIDL|nr:ABC transporter permease [Thiomonas delicata]SBP89425.1 Molybdate/tungstate transport system permease protein WtpB [Thiomonas delicata]